MRMVIDTGVFFRPDALRALGELPFSVIVPAVAFAERCRQLAQAGRDVEQFVGWLDANGFVVEPLDGPRARTYVEPLHDDAVWRRLARDAFIAGHLEKDDVLWTTDTDDFLQLGVPRERIVAVL